MRALFRFAATVTCMMNSRRLIVAPEAKDGQSYRQKRVQRKGSSMSALGQKRTCAAQNGMSALPRKRTCAGQKAMSALCPKRTLLHFWVALAETIRGLMDDQNGGPRRWTANYAMPKRRCSVTTMLLSVTTITVSARGTSWLFHGGTLLTSSK